MMISSSGSAPAPASASGQQDSVIRVHIASEEYRAATLPAASSSASSGSGDSHSSSPLMRLGLASSPSRLTSIGLNNIDLPVDSRAEVPLEGCEMLCCDALNAIGRCFRSCYNWLCSPSRNVVAPDPRDELPPPTVPQSVESEV